MVQFPQGSHIVTTVECVHTRLKIGTCKRHHARRKEPSNTSNFQRVFHDLSHFEKNVSLHVPDCPELFHRLCDSLLGISCQHRLTIGRLLEAAERIDSQTHDAVIALRVQFVTDAHVSGVEYWTTPEGMNFE